MQNSSDNLRLTPSIVSNLILSVFSFLMVIISLYWIFIEDQSDQILVAGGAFILFFILGFINFISLLPGSTYLELTPEGFTVCSLFRRSIHHFWNQVWGFHEAQMGTLTRVWYSYLNQKDIEKYGKIVAMQVCPQSAMLPNDYGMKRQDLVALLENWRLKGTEKRV